MTESQTHREQGGHDPGSPFFGIGSSGRGEALFRVAFSSVLLCDLWGLRHKLDLFFVTNGAHPTTALEGLYGHSIVHAAYTTWVVVGSLLLLGAFARLASIANLLFLVYFFGLRGAVAPHAANWALHAMGFCLVFMETDRYLSVRQPRWKAPPDAKPLPGWPIRLAQLSYTGIFFTAGISKLSDPAWRDGSAFALALFNPLVTRPSLPFVHDFEGVFSIVGLAIVAWEVSFPILLWHRRARPYAIGSALLFLVGVDLTLRVGWFTWAAIAFTTIFYDELFQRDDEHRGRNGPPPIPVGAEPFLLAHSWAFGVAMVGYLLIALGGPQVRIPILDGYVRTIAGVHYYNVWPTSYVADPVRLVRYEAIDSSGTPRAIPPFDSTGALRLSYFSREVREGLLGLRIEAAGMRPAGWDRYAEYLAARYSRVYGGACPSEIHFYGVRAPQSSFDGDPKALRVPQVPIATASFDCPGPTLRYVSIESRPSPLGD